jgi:hypothetical protein
MAKLSVSRAWDEAKTILARDGRLFVAVALALFVLPGLVLDLTMPESPPGELPKPGPWIAVAFVAILVALVGQLAVIRLAMGPHVSVGEAIAHGARRLLPYLAAVLIWTLPLILLGAFLAASIAVDPLKPNPGVALALLLLIAVGLFFVVRFMLSSAVASAEPQGPLGILRRSWSLTQGNCWRLFGFLLMFAIGAIVLLAAVESVLGLIAKLLLGDTGPLSVGGLVVSIVAQLLSALISVTFFVMLARLYHQAAGRDHAETTVPTTGI